MKILGISAFYHDSAAALIVDGEIIAAAQEERFTRIKHDPGFPSGAIRFCLEYESLEIVDLDAVVFYDKPLLKFERLLETYYGFSPKGLRSFVHAIPVWIKEKVFLKRIILQELAKICAFDRRKLKLLFSEHHLSHAGSTFFPSPFEEAAILTIDGVGEWATASMGYGSGNKIQNLKELHFPHSLGLLYSAFTYFLGFKVNSGEYKLMGLAPYGIAGSKEVKEYIKTIKEKLVMIHPDGSIWLNQKYFRYSTGLKMINDQQWGKLFGIKRRNSDDEIGQQHSNLAYAIQEVTEEIVLTMAGELKRITKAKNICLAGGVALNCVANGKLAATNLFDNIFIQPAAGDAGGAIGAAYTGYYIYFGKSRKVKDEDRMKASYLGPDYSNKEIEQGIRRFGAVYSKLEQFDELTEKVVQYISKGDVVGWFQGRMEFGPRALGNRSILGDARNKEMQKKLNLKIKFRESFRPFAPSVLAEDSQDYFDLNLPSPYMLLVARVAKKYLLKLPENYSDLALIDKLYVKRSLIPAVTHIDLSARIQTVHKSTNPAYWRLIKTFKKLTGCSLIVNTSFNVRGEPIVCSPEDAYRCFMRTEMDHLVIGNYLFHKPDQPEWEQSDKWKVDFKLD